MKLIAMESHKPNTLNINKNSLCKAVILSKLKKSWSHHSRHAGPSAKEWIMERSDETPGGWRGNYLSCWNSSPLFRGFLTFCSVNQREFEAGICCFWPMADLFEWFIYSKPLLFITHLYYKSGREPLCVMGLAFILDNFEPHSPQAGGELSSMSGPNRPSGQKREFDEGKRYFWPRQIWATQIPPPYKYSFISLIMLILCSS